MRGPRERNATPPESVGSEDARPRTPEPPAPAPEPRAPTWARALCEPIGSGWLDVGVALLVGAAYLWLLVRTVGSVGYTRDEGWYFQAAQSYGRWFELLWTDAGAALAQVDRFWRVNSEHPALLKSLFALGSFAQERWKLFEVTGTSYRFPAMLLSGLGVGLVYLWGTRARGRLVGVVAAASLGFMPRFFFHAHLACFDAPIVTMWTLCAYAYWRAIDRGGWAWPIAAGVTFGLALDTKHNSWFLPIVCGLHALLLLLAVLLRKWAAPSRRLSTVDRVAARRLFGRQLAALGAMATVGPAVFYALWPWIWHQTWARLEAYARFHLEHVYYNMEFLGRNYFEPPMPRAYAWVMTLATVPTITLLLFAVGLLVSVRVGLGSVAPDLRQVLGRARAGVVERATGATAEVGGFGSGTVLLWCLAVAVQYSAWLSPATPIFGGTKHWMTAYPFLALFAGTGLAVVVRRARHLWPARRAGGERAGGEGTSGQPVRARPNVLAQWVTRRVSGPALELGFVASVLAAPIVETLHAHPWGLSAYVPLVGGAPGGASLGLNRGFWGYTTAAVAPYLNATARKRARVYVHDTAGPSWQMLLTDGRLRRDLLGVGSIVGADFGLYHHEMHMQGQEYQNWVAFGTARPDAVAGLDGVPVIWVYRQPTPPRPTSGLLRPLPGDAAPVEAPADAP